LLTFNKKFEEPRYITIEKITKINFGISSLFLLLRIYLNNTSFLSTLLILLVLFMIVLIYVKSKFIKALIGLTLSIFSVLFALISFQ